MNKAKPAGTGSQNHQSLCRGAMANIPLAISAITYGGVLGGLSAQAVFAALTLSLWRGKGDLVPWDVSMVLALIVIIAASIITYAFRLGGLLLADRLPTTGPLRYFLDALPGTILVSLVVPSAANSGWQGLIGTAACLGIYLKTKSLLLTMITGVLTVYFIRLLC